VNRGSSRPHLLIAVAMMVFYGTCCAQGVGTTPRGPTDFALWVVFLVAGFSFCYLLFFRKKHLPRTTTAWTVTVIVASAGATLLFVGGYLEAKYRQSGGVVLMAGGASLLAASGIAATVASKWQHEDKQTQDAKQKERKAAKPQS